tara:strand:+ start:13176 stop:14315 length:1140 start_codon:yes stop_codon:yes gene_type:complete
MKSIKVVVVFLFIISFQQNLSQEIIKGNIKIDYTGQMTIQEHIENYFISDTLLLHKSIPLDRNNEEILINRQGVFRNTYLQYKNTDGIVRYSVNTPKTSYDNYFLNDSVFFISENYLALSKRTFNNKKKVDLNITLPSGFKLIYPKKEDFKGSFYKVPPIIAGDFDKKVYADFCVYQRSKVIGSEIRIKEIISIIEDAFIHFQNIFSKRSERPEIIFLPFKGKLAGKNIDNLIILNENFLTNKWINKKTLIHEVLHLWWGDNSIRFENPVLTEGITEFLTLNYLKKTEQKEYLIHLLKSKKKNIQYLEKYNLSFEKITNKKDYKIYCYDFLPLLLWLQNSENKVFNKLVSFYKNNSNSFISYSEGNRLLDELNIKIEMH